MLVTRCFYYYALLRVDTLHLDEVIYYAPVYFIIAVAITQPGSNLPIIPKNAFVRRIQIEIIIV